MSSTASASSATLRNLYRQLIYYGEDRNMLRRVYMLDNPKYLSFGLQALRAHRTIEHAVTTRKQTPRYKLITRTKLRWQIFSHRRYLDILRLRCKSVIAVINLLICCCVVLVCVALSRILHLIRIAMKDASDRHENQVRAILTVIFQQQEMQRALAQHGELMNKSDETDSGLSTVKVK